MARARDGFKRFPFRSPRQFNPSETRPPRKFSIKLAHRKRDQGAKSRINGGKHHFLRLSCASIRRLLVFSRWNWLFFDCVCVVLYRCVCHLLSFLLDLHCKAIAPHAVEKRCYCSLLTFLCFWGYGFPWWSLFLSFKVDGLSGPCVFFF